MTPEGRIVNYLVRRCRELGFAQRKLSYEGRRGAPDRLVLAHGKFAMAELKAPGEKPRQEQAREIARLREAGIPVYVCDSKHSVDWMLTELER